MKILFVEDRLDNSDPNVKLIQNISSCLSTHEIFFLAHSESKKVTCPNDHHRAFSYILDAKVRDFYFSIQTESLAQKLFSAIRHPILGFFGFLKLLNLDLICIPYKKQIRAICNTQKIDVVISVSAPFYTAKATAQAKVHCKKIILMFDP